MICSKAKDIHIRRGETLKIDLFVVLRRANDFNNKKVGE